MGRKRIDITGKRFSYLVVQEYVGVDKRSNPLWLCKCDCGNTKIVRGSKLKEGEIKSCGCMHHKHGHGLTNTRLYPIWRTMKARCIDSNSQKYPSYGARGITVCDEWLKSFDSFYKWAMSNGYADHLTLDRIDNDGNYCPENCRWATPKEQSNNTRSNHFVEFNGEKHTISEWSSITGISKSALYHRFSRGWSVDMALSVPQK